MSATRKESAANIYEKIRLTETECKLNQEIKSSQDSNALNQSSPESTNSEPDLLPLFDNILKKSKENPFYGYLELPEKVQLARHSQFSKLPGYQVISKITSYNSQLKLQLKQLLGYVVRGEKNKAEKLIKENPKLLLEKGIAEDYSGQLIEGTAYQMALGARDVNRVKLDEDGKAVLDEKDHFQILHPDEGMAEMIKSHFLDAFNQDEKAANSEIEKQQEEQFPGGYFAYINSAEVKQKRKNDSKALRDVVAAIGDADVSFVNGDYLNSNGEVKVDAKCEEALNKFRDYLRPKGIIKRGEHFNVILLLEAFRLFDDLYAGPGHSLEYGNEYEGCKNPKNALMWRKVIGEIQRHLPACYAQAFCQGLYYVLLVNQKLERSFKFDKDREGYEKAYYYPLDLDPHSRLGDEYAVWGVGPRRFRLGPVENERWFSRLCLAKNLCLLKALEETSKQDTVVDCRTNRL